MSLTFSMRSWRLLSKPLMAVLFCIAIVLPVYADEKRNALERFILNELPGYADVNFQEMRYKDFPSGNGGRLSVAGRFYLNQDFVERDKTGAVSKWPKVNRLLDALRAEGYNKKQWNDAIVSLGWRNTSAFTTAKIYEYFVVNQKGGHTDFRGELPYLETVDGISISGKLDYAIPRGLPVSKIRAIDYVVGRPSFDRTIKIVKDEIARQK